VPFIIVHSTITKYRPKNIKIKMSARVAIKVVYLALDIVAQVADYSTIAYSNSGQYF
jgi:hypothetical protein